MRKIFRIVLLLTLAVMAAFSATTAFAEGEVTIEPEGFAFPAALSDDDRLTWSAAGPENVVTVTCEDGLHSVYVQFDQVPVSTYTITDPATGKTIECGTNYFLHDYNNVEELFGSKPKKLELRFAEDAVLTDIYGYPGEEPKYVQKWQPCLEKADLLLLSTHADDEQLYFAGVLPYYAIERKLDVQVVYFIQHFTVGDIHKRPHELLDGLWTVGIRNYPYFSEFPDLYSVANGRDRQTVVTDTVQMFSGYGYTYDDFLGFTVKVLRRFKPLVVVTHDLDGEYGHAAHILNADVMCQAVQISGDEKRFEDSAKEYGAWTPEKVYLHLYDQNQLVMDWDTPYESMNGMTPFEMTQMGFACHLSQQYPMFAFWLYGTEDAPITRASQIIEYSPCRYGLYYSAVGADVRGGDMFENVVTYADKAKAEEEARRKAEEEEARKKAEEEAAKKAAEEEARKKAEEEAARKAAEEAAAKAQKEAKQMRTRIAIFAVCAVLAIILFIVSRRSTRH